MSESDNSPEPVMPVGKSHGDRQIHTIESLRLNLDAVRAGRTWELLPEGFREMKYAEVYPLPSPRDQLQLLVSVYLPRVGRAPDSGIAYMRRARASLKTRERLSARITATATPERNVERAAEAMKHHLMREREKHKELRAQAELAVAELKEVAARHIANLDQLFEVGREGMLGMMKAHMDGTPWKGEQIDAQAFRQCFRMVTQAVKGLGIPSDQKEPATQAILNERVAAALKDTQDAISLAPNAQPDDEVN